MKLLFALALLSALLTGCVVVPEHENYRGGGWEHHYDDDRDFRYQDHG